MSTWMNSGARAGESARFISQAEGGIRDLTVTGVQTCALPIWVLAPARRPAARIADAYAAPPPAEAAPGPVVILGAERKQRDGGGRDAHHTRVGEVSAPRSEERRVGKECRSRWSPYH